MNDKVLTIIGFIGAAAFLFGWPYYTKWIEDLFKKPIKWFFRKYYECSSCLRDNECLVDNYLPPEKE